jgi:hypothetical protein
MIKFNPHTYPLPEEIGLGSADKLIHNKSNSAFSIQLNNRFEGKCCEAHSDFENTIVVDLSDEENFMSIEKYCCEDFKLKLDMITQNQDPYIETPINNG